MMFPSIETMRRAKKLPLPFAVEWAAANGTMTSDRASPLSDGWYYLRNLGLTFFVHNGLRYGPNCPEAMSVEDWWREFSVLEHIETCGRKHPHLATLVPERTQTNRFLLQLEKFEDTLLLED